MAALGAVSGRDLISGLPDELLHEILGRLPSITAAVRTSILARRWCRVWANLPKLVLGDDQIDQDASFLDTVDGALVVHSAAHVHGLKITVPYDTPADRVASWLRFASRRLAGELYLHMHLPRLSSDQWKQLHVREKQDLELPLCEGATSIKFLLYGARFLVRPQPPAPGGVMFAALTDLSISQATMEGGALEDLVSTQCPRLRKLNLELLALVAASDITIRSGSLRQLKFDVRKTLMLDVATPALEVLDLTSKVAGAYVAAPSLAEVVWGNCTQFVFVDAKRHLRRLEVRWCSAMAPLMRRFGSVDELRLRTPNAADGGCKRFFDDAYNNLPMCRTLSVSSVGDNHCFFFFLNTGITIALQQPCCIFSVEETV